MYTYVYIYIYKYIYTYTYIYIYVYIHIPSRKLSRNTFSTLSIMRKWCVCVGGALTRVVF